MSEQPAIEVEASPTFNRNLRTLAKKYRNIRSDIQPVVNQLKQGELLGEEIPRIGFEVFKVRVRNSDVQKGKSGGYRLIYYVKTETRLFTPNQNKLMLQQIALEILLPNMNNVQLKTKKKQKTS
jgi:mRNA-degrading endonuclease RelE of RelBE toxin-antitoxin system